MPSQSPSHRSRPGLGGPALATVLALLAAAALSACGGSSPAGSAASERAAERQDEAKAADFAKCLREHGIHAETVSGSGSNRALNIEGKGGPQAMEAAQRACARYRPAPKRINLSPQQKVEFEERLQKFAKCMREHGIKVEASTQGGGVQIGIHGHAGGGEPNPGSPGFQRAQAACQTLMPKPPGGGKFGPGSPGTSKGGPGGAAVGFAIAGG